MSTAVVVRKGEIRGSRLVVVLCTVGLLIVVGATSAFYLFGERTHLREARLAEARIQAATLARGVAQCSGAKGGVLPPTSRQVPADARVVDSYTARRPDWEDEAFQCASYAPIGELSAAMSWVKLGDDHGEARAAADVDGHGAISVVAMGVECIPPARAQGGIGGCRLGETREWSDGVPDGGALSP